MKTSNCIESAPIEFAELDEWARLARKVAAGFRAGVRILALLGHRQPGFRERHLLDGRLGIEIRRSTW